MTLPRHYLVGNWPLAWTGFDIVLLGCLSTTAWSLWKQRQVAVPAAMITCVMLLCDAWFDIVTAHGGRCLMISVATAVFAELPIATLLGMISVRLLRAGMRVARGVEPTTGFLQLWRAPLPDLRRPSVLPPGVTRNGVWAMADRDRGMPLTSAWAGGDQVRSPA